MNYTFNEVSCLVADNEIISFTKGSPGLVTFDFFAAWNKWKQKPFKSLKMIHVHPASYPNMSSIDANMLPGWAKAFPIEIDFTIFCRVFSPKLENDNFFEKKYLAQYKDNDYILHEENLKIRDSSDFISEVDIQLIKMSNNLDLFDEINNKYLGKNYLTL
jgi:hypothetical protein